MNIEPYPNKASVAQWFKTLRDFNHLIFQSGCEFNSLQWHFFFIIIKVSEILCGHFLGSLGTP